MAAPAALIASYLAQARGFRQALGEVNSFVRSLLRPMFDSAPESVRKHAFLGQLLRVQGWLGTLVRLDDPADFQAVLCGERTLFELALDIVLLSGDPSGPEKLIEWEESAKLKQAHLGMKYVKSKGGLPEEHFGWATRLEMETEIEAKRKHRGWSKGHPERWTGPGRNLLTDAVAGDKQQTRFGFEGWYQTRYRSVCWSVHGSALVTRMLPMHDYPGVVALSLKWSADLAQEAARSAVEAMGFLSSEEAEGAFDRLGGIRAKAFADANPEVVAEIQRRRREAEPKE